MELACFYDTAAKRGKLGEFRARCQQHPLREIVRQDPLTERAFSKPRGYSDHAAMLDYIYRPKPQSLNDTARQLHSATTGVSSAKSISWRRDHLGTEIAKVVAEVADARILSVASGHLREFDVVRELTGNKDFRIDALDQDDQSLKEAVCSYPDFNINAVHKSITHLFRTGEQACYDLIYSAGLFDYLPAKTASALLQRLLELLKPDGRLVVRQLRDRQFRPRIHGRHDGLAPALPGRGQHGRSDQHDGDQARISNLPRRSRQCRLPRSLPKVELTATRMHRRGRGREEPCISF